MNTFGQLFRVTTFGESHGGGVGVVVDGCPAGLKLDPKDFKQDLDRRRTGQSSIVSTRKEADELEILSGVFEGKTLGTPICLMVRNKDARPKDYKKLKNVFRPSHADFTYEMKYGIRNWQGGGRASARETVGRVIAGVIAKKLLRESFLLDPFVPRRKLGTSPLKRGESPLLAKKTPVEILAYVKQVGPLMADIDPEKVTLKKVESNIIRCPNQKVAKKMIEFIKEVQKEGDTVGGVVECVVKNVPVGLGDPVFDKLKATLSHAMMSLPAAVGFDVGMGFESLDMLGSEHNDEFFVVNAKGKIQNVKKIATRTNHSGGIQGGISNGMPIVFRTVFKPVSTIFKPQRTVTSAGKFTILKMSGRHDPCVVPRAVVMVEAMAAIVLVDHWLRQRAVSL